MHKTSHAILYFVKYPMPGKVKTRLAKSIGNQEAAKVYQQLALKNFLVLRECRNVNLIVTFDSLENEFMVRQWLLGADAYVAQEGVGLGERLSNAFTWAFNSGYRKVTAIGSDILNLTTVIGEHSFVALSQADVVIGPAKDGGYYLIGLSSLQPDLFEGISWSTSEVLKQTFKIIDRLNLKYFTLSPLEDLDDIKSGGIHEFIND